MLEFLSSVVATTIEGVCIFVLTLNLFRFKARDHVSEIIIANLIVSITNFMMQKYNFYYDYSALLNALVLILILIFAFKVSVLESVIMAVCGFLAVAVIQSIVIVVFTLFNNVTLKQIRIEDARYILQVISGLMFLAVSWYLNKKHLWFTFVPFRRFFKISITKLNIKIMISLMASLIALGIVIKLNNLITIAALSGALLILVLFFVIKKEKKDDREDVFKHCQSNKVS